jgi:CHAT domain-containing protein
MNDENVRPNLFVVGDYGRTVARNLLRSLALQDFNLASSLLEIILKHGLIKSGLKSTAQETLLSDLENWIAGSDHRFEYHHARLVLDGFKRLNIQCDWRLTMLAMTRAYTGGDFEFAEKTANDILLGAGLKTDTKLIVECHNVLGRLHSDRGEFDLAAEHFVAGAKVAEQGKLDFEEWDLHTSCVWCLQKTGNWLEALQQINIAEQVARRINRLDALAKSLIDRGNTHNAVGNLKEARTAFESALVYAEKASDLARQSDALGNLGIIAYQDADYTVAENYHRRALTISRTLSDKKSAQADFNNLAQALWGQGRSEEAVEAQEKALEIARVRKDEADIARYSDRLRFMCQAAGMYVPERFKPTVTTQPNLPLPHKENVKSPDYDIEKRVRSLLADGKVALAIQFLEDLVQKTPDDCGALCLYGAVLAFSGEDGKARTQFEHALELFPEATDPHIRLVDLCTKTGQLDFLLARYEKSVADQPFSAALRLGLALIYSRKEYMDEAIRQGLEAVRLAPDEELALRVLAETQFVKAQSLLRSNWQGAWIVFQDCVTTLTKLTHLNSERKGQWLAFAANKFEQFAMNSHQSNPPLDGMHTREVSILTHAARYYQEAQDADPIRSAEQAHERITNVLLGLGNPHELAITAGYMQTDGCLREALFLLRLSLERDPEQAEAYYQLARVMHETGGEGSRESVLEYIARALKIDPQNQVYRQAERFFQRAPEVPVSANSKEMNASPNEMYWEAIASSRDTKELRKAIASDCDFTSHALDELLDLLFRLEPLSASIAVDQLQWLAIELSEAVGDDRVSARFQALRMRNAALEALRVGSRNQAVDHLSSAAATSLKGDSIEAAIRITRFSVLCLFQLGEIEAGLRVTEAMIDAVERHGFGSMAVRIALYEFSKITRDAPAREQWANVLARIRAGMEQEGDLNASMAVATYLAATLIRQGAYEDGQELLADLVPTLSRMITMSTDGRHVQMQETEYALLWQARALDLGGQETAAEDAYRSHPWFTSGKADERAEIISRLVELLIKNSRLQEALDLLESSAFESQKFQALALALIGIVYALLNRSEASAAAMNEALSLLGQRRETVFGASRFERLVAEDSGAFETLFVPDETHWRIHLAVLQGAVLRGKVDAVGAAKLQEVSAWARQNGERAMEARCLWLEGEIALASGKAETAIQKLEAALHYELTSSGTQKWKSFSAQTQQPLSTLPEPQTEQVRSRRLEAGVGAETLIALGRAQAAGGFDPVSTWDAGIEAAQRRNRRLTLYYALVAEAQWMSSAGRDGEARPLFERAVDTLESLRADLLTMESQIGVLEDKETIYGELLFATVRSADAQLAMRLMESAKARALLEEIGEIRRPLTGEEEQEARRLRQEMVRFIGLQMNGQDIKRLSLERLKDRFASVYRRAGSNRRIKRRPGGPAGDVARLSVGGYAILEYFVSEKHVIVAVAREGRLIPPIRLSCNKADLSRMVETFQFEISTRERCYSLTELYSALVEPVETCIEGAERVIFVLHGLLHFVPMHALTRSDGVCLSKKFVIHYAPSVAVAIKASEQSVAEEKAGALLIAADQVKYGRLPKLPHAANEVEQASKWLPDSQIFAGKDALRQHVLRGKDNIDILHLACHGEFDRGNPLLSRIYLTDGPLYGFEIEWMSWRPRLVVLSACETAVQRRVAGDETLGLVRAFLSRGAISVIACLWKVADESTAMLMGALYRELSSNPGDVAGALRLAQLEVLSSQNYAHPFFWAPYVLIGGPGYRVPAHKGEVSHGRD